MARLLDWPGFRVVAWQPLSGPRTVGASSNESVTGFVQTVSSAFGGWRWQLTLEPLKGRSFRLYRGMVAALNGGANAVRVPFCDPDGLSWADAGMNITAEEIREGTPWFSGLPWANSENWGASRPWVTIAADAAEGDSIVNLADEFWGHTLIGGEWIGFSPLHFGLYVITEVLSAGQYRIWPPLRKAIDTDGYATLRPVMAMRLEAENSATASRGAVRADAPTLTLVEVQDADVRDYFNGGDPDSTLVLGEGGRLLI